jgi:hypothetical protein
MHEHAHHDSNGEHYLGLSTQLANPLPGIPSNRLGWRSLRTMRAQAETVLDSAEANGRLFSVCAAAIALP